MLTTLIYAGPLQFCFKLSVSSLFSGAETAGEHWQFPKQVWARKDTDTYEKASRMLWKTASQVATAVHVIAPGSYIHNST